MSDDLPRAIAENVLQIGEHKLRVYVLDDGRRIINADDVCACLANIAVDDEDMAALAEALKGART